MTKEQERKIRASIYEAQEKVDKLKEKLATVTGEEVEEMDEEEVSPKRAKTLGDPVCELY